MDELTKNFLEHYRATHPGMPIKYFDADEGLPISAFNLIEEPTFPPKTVYQDFPPQAKGHIPMTTERDTHFLGFAKQELEDLKPDLTLLFVALGSPLSRREEEIASA